MRFDSEVPPRSHLLVFGASGSIGRAICHSAVRDGWQVTAVARALLNPPIDGVRSVKLDPFAPEFSLQDLAAAAPFSGVCWAQGANLNDSVYTFRVEDNLYLYQVNVLYILITLKALLDEKMLTTGSRLCVISSIWQNIAKQSKLSYCVTKAALQGLVLSASADLAEQGHLINAVLPGAIDTPMTRMNLSEVQIKALSEATGFHRMTSLDDVTALVLFLCSSGNTGVTGQFITADLGFSHVRLV